MLMLNISVLVICAGKLLVIVAESQLGWDVGSTSTHLIMPQVYNRTPRAGSAAITKQSTWVCNF